MTQINTDLIPEINRSLDLQFTASLSYNELHKKLSAEINHLINNNFEKLVFYLYRIDVDENKMRFILDQNEGENAADLIADLIIERQLQKIESRKKFRNDGNIDEDEKW